uniref:Uncharacterized protein n=1 Tax=Anguilla anguilla TaxID=7936 RepID=A0A0E9S2U2_ANGAN
MSLLRSAFLYISLSYIRKLALCLSAVLIFNCTCYPVI